MSAALSQGHSESADLVGTFGRIGGIGPVFEVLGPADGDLVRICLLESGEEIDYPAADARADAAD